MPLQKRCHNAEPTVVKDSCMISSVFDSKRKAAFNLVKERFARHYGCYSKSVKTRWEEVRRDLNSICVLASFKTLQNSTSVSAGSCENLDSFLIVYSDRNIGS